METMSFMSACKQYFGLLPDERPLEFGKEVKALTQQDREEMIPMLEKELGVVIEVK